MYTGLGFMIQTYTSALNLALLSFSRFRGTSERKHAHGTLVVILYAMYVTNAGGDYLSISSRFMAYIGYLSAINKTEVDCFVVGHA